MKVTGLQAPFSNSVELLLWRATRELEASPTSAAGKAYAAVANRGARRVLANILNE
jgi:hypothetical protein